MAALLAIAISSLSKGAGAVIWEIYSNLGDLSNKGIA